MRFPPFRRPRPVTATVSRAAASGLLLASILGVGCSSPAPGSASDPSAVTAGLDRPGSPPATAYATFDAVWSTVDERHFDPDHGGVDWASVRATYRPEIETTRSQDDVRRLLQQMLGELGQSHFVIIPKDAAASASADSDASADGPKTEIADATDAGTPADERGVIGLRLDWSGDDALVVDVRPGSPADAAGVRPGWRLDRMDDFEPTRDLAGIRAASAASGAPFAVTQSAMILNARSTGEVGSTSTFTFTDGSGEVHERTIGFEQEPGERIGFGLLPPTPFAFETRTLTPGELDAWGISRRPDGSIPTIVVTSFNIWLFPALKPMADAVDAHRDADGFIIDLRGNPGGVGGLAMGVAGHFLADEESLGDLVSRDTTMHFAVNPQKVTMDGRLVDPFAGPLVIVTDSGSASTSEVFAAGLQQLDRATIVGRPSAGAALPAHLMLLPNGDTFMFAIADFIGPAGHSIEGTGVLPDIAVPLDRSRLLAEGDPDLAAAARWICRERESD